MQKRMQLFVEVLWIQKLVGSVIELANLLKHSGLDIDCGYIDNVLSLISEIWGELTRKQHRHASDYFIRLGKLVEK